MGVTGWNSLDANQFLLSFIIDEPQYANLITNVCSWFAKLNFDFHLVIDVLISNRGDKCDVITAANVNQHHRAVYA